MADLIIEMLTVGPFMANCYLVGCPETLEAVVIDPGGDARAILAALATRGLKARYVVNTHGHVDHIAANAQVKAATGAEILIHEADAAMLTNPARSLALLSAVTVRQSPADRTLAEGESVKVGSVALEVVHTPGHTPGGICLKAPGLVFSGDTLFAGSIGRTDFPGGSFQQLISSIREKLLVLPDETVIYPGHGPATTVAEERVSNPFLQGGQGFSGGENFTSR